MRQWVDALLRWEVPLFFIVLLRLVVGVELIAQGYSKVQDGYVQQVREKEERPNPLQVTIEIWVDDMQERNVFPWYRIFLKEAVLPNINTFAVLVTVAEIALGAMLVLGLLVRVASVFGILLCLNYLFATWHEGFPYPTLNILFLATLLVFVLVSAGRCLGVDALLHKRFPEIPLL